MPACFRCNNSACSFDEIFKFISAICAIRLGQCPQDCVAAIAKTLKKQRKLKAVIENAKISQVSEEKVIIPRDMGSNFDDVIRRIVRELYYYECKRLLPALYVSVHTLIGFDDGTIENVLNRKNKIVDFLNLVDFNSLKCKVVKKNVFEYRYGVVPDKPEASVWCLLFRNSLLVFGISRDSKEYF